MKRIFTGLCGSSVLWGLVATFAFYSAIDRGAIVNETIVRYSVGHPVEYATIGMFWIGLFDLIFKIASARRERRSLRRGALFPPKSAKKEPISKANEYLESIAKAREVRGDSAYFDRLTEALDFLKFGGSPDDLDQELRYLADDAYDRRDASYGMVRAFIWAIPILGFLGTVLGITVALGSLDLTQLNATSEKLADGLKVAFDTTALSLTLVFALFFVQFFARKQDAILARRVSKLVDSELKGRFYDERESASDVLGGGARAILQTLVAALDETLDRQSKSWNKSMARVAEEIGAAFDRRLTEGGSAWTQTLADAQSRFVEGSLKPALDEARKSGDRLAALETKVGQEIEALRETLKATADVVALEDRLARTLEKLAEVGQFEDTLNNLTATVCLLNSKLTSTTPTRAPSRRSTKNVGALAALKALDLPVAGRISDASDEDVGGSDGTPDELSKLANELAALPDDASSAA